MLVLSINLPIHSALFSVPQVWVLYIYTVTVKTFGLLLDQAWICLDFPDFKHDYIKEVYRSDMCFAGPGLQTGDFHSDCIQGQNVVTIHQYDRPPISTVLTTELAMHVIFHFHCLSVISCHIFADQKNHRTLWVKMSYNVVKLGPASALCGAWSSATWGPFY